MSIGVALALVVLAYGPLLTLLAVDLWHREHYQFFPLACIAAIVLFLDRLRNLGPLEPDKTAVSRTLAVIAFLVMACAVALPSPWLAAISFVILLPGLAGGVGGLSLRCASYPSLLLLLLIIPPPLKWDQLLINQCQSWSTVLASKTMDLLYVAHLRSGNVLELPGKQLLVDQACSGMNSLLPGLALSLFLGFYLRRPGWHVLLLVAASAFFVFLCNVLRLVSIGVAFAGWSVDWSEGWPHTVVGLTCFALFLSLLFSQDQLLCFFGKGIPIHQSKSVKMLYSAIGDMALTEDVGAWLEEAFETNSEIEAERLSHAPPLAPVLGGEGPGVRGQNLGKLDALTPTPLPGVPGRGAYGTVSEPANPTMFVLTRNSWLAKWPAPVCLCLLLAVEGLCLYRDQAKGPFFQGSPVVSLSLPATLAGWDRAQLQADERDRHRTEGEHSQSWLYRHGSLRAVVAIDYPFFGWHDLSVCYQSQGWTIQTRSVGRDEQDATQTVVDILMTDAVGQEGTLRFGLVDAQGRWAAEAPPLNALEFISGRFPLPRRQARTEPLYQLQVVTVNARPLAEIETRQIRDLYKSFCGCIVPQLMSAEAKR